MKITLNAANKLRDALEKCEVTIPITFDIRTDEPDVLKQAEIARKLLQGAIEKEIHRLTAVFKLRELINDSNNKSGVHVVIGEIASVNASLASLKSISEKLSGISRYGRTNTGADINDFIAQKKFNDERASKDIQYAVPPSRVSIKAYTQEDVDDVAKASKEYKRRLAALIDERNKINFSTIIEIPEDMVKFLREFDLV